MGWLWNSGPSKETIDTPPAQGSTADALNPLPPTTADQAVPISSPPSEHEASKLVEGSDPELAALLRQLEAVISKSPKPTEAPKSTSTSEKDSDISPDSLYPTKMSCRSTFDYAMFCQSFGGQFVNIYRYGTFRSCSNHWEDFWLCMRTRQWEKKKRERAIADHYRKKAIKYKQGPSSEDVWEMRTEPIQNAFKGNLEEVERVVAEWKKENPGIEIRY